MIASFTNHQIRKWEFNKEKAKAAAGHEVHHKPYVLHEISWSTDGDTSVFMLKIIWASVLRDKVNNNLFITYETETEYYIDNSDKSNTLDILSNEVSKAYERHGNSFLKNPDKILFNLPGVIQQPSYLLAAQNILSTIEKGIP